MACREFEDLILDYCEGAASPADCSLLEAHIAVCQDCRAALAEQQELDLRLARSFSAPSLSPAFDAKLAARISAEPPPVRFRHAARILDAVGYVSVAAAGAWLIGQLPHSGSWLALTAVAASAGFGFWQTAKALRANYSHR